MAVPIRRGSVADAEHQCVQSGSTNLVRRRRRTTKVEENRVILFYMAWFQTKLGLLDQENSLFIFLSINLYTSLQWIRIRTDLDPYNTDPYYTWKSLFLAWLPANGPDPGWVGDRTHALRTRDTHIPGNDDQKKGT